MQLIPLLPLDPPPHPPLSSPPHLDIPQTTLLSLNPQPLNLLISQNPRNRKNLNKKLQPLVDKPHFSIRVRDKREAFQLELHRKAELR